MTLKGKLRFHLTLALLVSAMVLCGRGFLIVGAQSTGVDDAYHLFRGIMYWHRNIPEGLEMNDPPLGEAITAIPALFATELPGYRRLNQDDITHNISDRTLEAIGLFKSLLLLPLIGAMFVWAVGRWGFNAGWLAVALVLTEPTIAAHTPLPTTDVLGMEAIALTGLFAWMFFQEPSLLRAIGLGAAMGVSLMVKHTAVILPGIVVIMALVCWGILPMVRGESGRIWIRGLRARGMWIAAIIVTMPLVLWATTLFDCSRPHYPGYWNAAAPHWVKTLVKHHRPAGVYIGSFLDAYAHSWEGHASVLFGKVSQTGWWYYFPAIATMKLPLGIWALLLLAIISLFFIKPRWHEVGAVICFICYALFLMHSSIDIGFRHALPAYIFALLLCVRVAAVNRVFVVLAWVCVAAAFTHVMSYHPDYLSYVNRSIDKPWMQMSDSNIDWGRAGKQVGQWVQKHAPNSPEPITYFGSWYVKPEWQRGFALGSLGQLPDRGLLIVTPLLVTGQYLPVPDLQMLQGVEPIAVIAHSQLVYDLNLIPEWKRRK